MSVKIPALNSADSAGDVEVSEDVFGREYNETLIHQLATKTMAGLRSGTKAQKIDRLSVAVELNLGNKKVQVAQDLVQYAVHFGEAVVLHLLRSQDLLIRS